MSILFYAAYFIAGGLMVNGFFHYLMGIMGRKFIKRPKMLSQERFNKMTSGTSSFNSAVYNIIYGMIQLIIAFLILTCIGKFHFGLTWETGILILNIVISSLLSAWNFEGTLS